MGVMGDVQRLTRGRGMIFKVSSILPPWPADLNMSPRVREAADRQVLGLRCLRLAYETEGLYRNILLFIEFLVLFQRCVR